MGTTTVTSRDEVRQVMGYGRNVRRYEGATIVDRASLPCPEDGPWAGCVVELTLSSGKASDGYRSDYQHHEVWWCEIDLRNQAGRIVWHDGRRYGGKRCEHQARKDFTGASAG